MLPLLLFALQCYAAQMWQQDDQSYAAQWKDSYDGQSYAAQWEQLASGDKRQEATVRTFHAAGSVTQLTHLIAQSEGFCYISGVRAIYRDAERCAVVPDHGFWALEATSGQRDYECRATCVIGIPATISGVYRRNEAGDTPSIIDLGPVSNRVCYLTGLRRMSSHSQECETLVSNGRWQLRGRSQHGDFRCEARCAAFSQHTTRSQEVTYTGRGSWTQQLGHDFTFCYVSNVRNINLGDEICRVTRDPLTGWTLNANSNQNTFRCGATCATVSNQYTSITAGWRLMASAASYQSISQELPMGVSRGNSAAGTEEWSNYFLDRLSSPGFLQFGTVPVTPAIIVSTLPVIEACVSGEMTWFVAHCPAQPGMYVALYQYTLEGEYLFGSNDVVWTSWTRCHYSSSINLLEPQCPFQACGVLNRNPSCQQSLCDPWMRLH
jgi:hypothetical protein